MITKSEETYQRSNGTCWKRNTWFIEFRGLRLPIWTTKGNCPAPFPRRGTLH